jgi:two-component system, OmpR family, alkaline phosphatase synthesis response regulator PhoP
MDGRGNSRSVILCVDDHWAALELRKRVLEKAGYTALVATTARKALEIFRTRRVDLVLTEHVAPAVVDGPTFTATMRADYGPI